MRIYKKPVIHKRGFTKHMANCLMIKRDLRIFFNEYLHVYKNFKISIILYKNTFK